MKPAAHWSRSAADAGSRAGVLHTPHGEVQTPAFMPVGTRATVKTVDSDDLEDFSVAEAARETTERGAQSLVRVLETTLGHGGAEAGADA